MCSITVVNFPQKHPLFDFTERIVPSISQIERKYELAPDHYLIKVIHKNYAGQGAKFILNDDVVEPFKIQKKKNIETSLFHISPEQIREKNVLKIDYGADLPEKAKIRIQNYRHSPIRNGIVFFFRPTLSELVKLTPLRSIATFVLFSGFFMVVFGIVGEKNKKTVIRIIIVLNLVLSFIAIVNFVPFTKHVVLISSRYLLFWSVFVVYLMIIPYLARIICKKRARCSPQAISEVSILIFVASITPFFLLHGMFTNPGLFPIEVFDESAHTYTEIPLVHKALLDGHILKMNFFNNFGTPLIGDPVTNPFAVHALSYFLFKPHIAMTCNKISLSILTFLTLFFFYRRRGLSFYSSTLTAFLTYTAPSFYWFFQHHPHQGVLFYFSAILLLMDLALDKGKITYYILLHFGFIVLFLSSGIMGLFLGTSFLFIFSLIITKLNIKQFTKLFLLPLCSGFILTHPQLLYFLKIAPLTARSAFSFENVNPYSFIDILKCSTFLTNVTGYHTDYSLNYSLVVLVFVILGLVTYRIVKNNLNILLSVILGLLPFLAVIVLLRYRTLQAMLPVVKSIDLTRTMWFSTVFLMIPLGYMVDNLRYQKISPTSTKYLILLFAPVLLFIGFWVDFDKSFIDILIYVLSPIIILTAYYKLVKSRNDNDSAFKWFKISVFVLLVIPRLEVYKSLTDCFYPKEMVSYEPVKFIEHMKQSNRLSSCQMPSRDEARYASPDQKIAKYNIFGSAGRSIITHGGFRTFLEKDDLITFGWLKMLYYFKVNSPDMLSKFGIRYFVTQAKDSAVAEQFGWEKTSSVKDLVLFENPLKPSPFYYIKDGQLEFIRNYKFSYDRIEIDIPKIGSEEVEVVATFIAWPGWQAKLDGKRVDIIMEEDQFITVNCQKSGKLVLEFEPYSDRYIITSGILTILFMLICCVALKKKH